MQQKIEKKLFVFKVIAFELVAPSSHFRKKTPVILSQCINEMS